MSNVPTLLHAGVFAFDVGSVLSPKVTVALTFEKASAGVVPPKKRHRKPNRHCNVMTKHGKTQALKTLPLQIASLQGVAESCRKNFDDENAS